MRRASSAAGLVLLLATGCRTPGVTFAPLEPDDPRPAELLDRLFTRADAARSLRGYARLAVDGPQGSLRSKQMLAAERPAQLRVEILGLMNQTVALLVTDGESYDYFESGSRRREYGPIPPDLLERVSGIPLSPDEVVEVLMGAPIAPPEWSPVSPGESAEGDIGVAVAAPASNERQRFEFFPNGDLRRWLRGYVDGGVRWIVDYDEYEKVGRTRIAHSIELRIPSSGVEARIGLRDLELNPQLPVEVFRVGAALSTEPTSGER